MPEVCNQIEMEAPPDAVFRVISDLDAWPRYLPHYRWIRVLESHPDYRVVRMACYRGWIPIDWVSRFHADASARELHFNHLKAFTRGMHVVWRLESIRHGAATRVIITHELQPVIRRWGRFVAEWIIAGFFIDHVAARTLKGFARHFRSESRQNPRAPQETRF